MSASGTSKTSGSVSESLVYDCCQNPLPTTLVMTLDNGVDPPFDIQLSYEDPLAWAAGTDQPRITCEPDGGGNSVVYPSASSIESGEWQCDPPYGEWLGVDLVTSDGDPYPGGPYTVTVSQ